MGKLLKNYTERLCFEPDSFVNHGVTHGEIIRISNNSFIYSSLI